MMIPIGLNSLLASTVGALPTGLFGMPEQASTLAPSIDFIYELITWISIFFFLLIVGLMVYFVIRYHKPPGTPAEGSVIHNTPIEVIWTVLPLLLVIYIFYVGMQGYINLRSAPLDSYEINVVAQKWNWQFNYKNGATTSELIIPVGRPVKLLMSSKDVLHSVFIPAFRIKQDVVPGRITMLWFEAVEPGIYDLYCAEYCGTQHSTMLTKVIALEDEEFDEALLSAANWPDLVPADKLYVGGPRLFARCKSCHTLDGSSLTGPSWKGLWERTVSGETVFSDGTTLSDLTGQGRLFNSPEDYIMQSITNPKQKLVATHPTGSMPTFQGQLDPLEIMIIIDFLKNLDKFDAKGVPLDPADDLSLILEQAKEARQAEEAAANE